MFPVVRKKHRCMRLPDEALDPRVKEILQNAGASLLPYESRDIPRLLKRFECYLQITNQLVSWEDFKSEKFWLTALLFLGALNSNKFIKQNSYARYKNSQAWLSILNESGYEHNQFYWPLHTGRPTREIEFLTDTFERSELNNEKVKVWHGWSVTNRKGITSYLYFYPLTKEIGNDFVNRMHQLCENYYSSSADSYIEGIDCLINFIATSEANNSPEKLHNRKFMTEFWMNFLIYYIEHQTSKNVSLTAISRSWNTSIKPLCINYFIAEGLMSGPEGPFPEIPRRAEKKVPNIGINPTTGEHAFLKLLTPIPLNISDDEALKLLFNDIKNDLDIVIAWAREEVNALWNGYLRRSNKLWLAEETEIKCMFLGPQLCPKISKAISHYKKNGYPSTECRADRKIYTPMPENAKKMGMPVTGALIPHCILLVHNHPEITPAFLEGIELYSKHGKLTGFYRVDATWYLSGHKYRKGARTSSQVIQLNDFTTNIVKQIIAITDDARNHLKNNNHDHWRFLLLSTGKSFAIPRRSNRLAACTSGARLPMLHKQLQINSKMSKDKAEVIAKALSLPAIRATTAVVEYLQTGDAIGMSKRLGHEKYDPDLLKRYLPEPLYRVFQDRWIRIFQNGLIAEVMHDSPNLLAATDFETENELMDFLNTHAVRVSCTWQKLEKKVSQPTTSHNLIFIISQKNITALMNLRKKRQNHPNISGEEAYWINVLDHLEMLIDSMTDRTDLQSIMTAARKAFT